MEDTSRASDLVELVLPAKVVDHLGHRRAGDRVALVVGELEIGDLRAVLVPPTRLTQVHADILARPTRSVEYSCAYASLLFRDLETL